MIKKSFKFSPNNEVDIIPLKTDGIVIGVYFTLNCIEYNVRYFNGLEMKTAYFYESEISEKQEKQPLHFKTEK